MRVTVVGAQLCSPVPGGTGRYTAELVQALTGAAGGADSVRVVAPTRCSHVAQLGVDVGRLGVPLPALSRLWERGLPPYLHGPGVVHAPTLLVPPVKHGAWLVVTIHDVVPWTHPSTLTARGVSFHRRMGARAARQADLIVTPSEATAEGVRHHLAPPCPVVVVHPGVSTLRSSGSETIELGGPPNRPFVLFVGTAEPRKGLDLLVRAMATTATRDLDLVVAGPSGWGGVSVAELARDQGIGDRVHVTGPVPDGALTDLYRAARVVAMPSLAEGFGLPVLEAMSLGTPVVTSDDAALVEVAAGAAVALADRDAHAWGEALAAVAEQGTFRDGLVSAGRARSMAFSWDASAAKLWDLYRALRHESYGHVG